MSENAYDRPFTRLDMTELFAVAAPCSRLTEEEDEEEEEEEEDDEE